MGKLSTRKALQRKRFLNCLKQKKAIEKSYNCFKYELVCGDTLICTGSIQPDPASPKYQLKIRYKPGYDPTVEVLDPKVKLCSDIHVYKEGALCLFYPREQPWSHLYLIAETIIPWTAEWLVYYELYLITGKWEGPEIKH